MIVLSNTAAQTIQPGAAATFNVVKLHTGCGEFHRTGSGSVRLRAGLYAFDFTGNVGGAAGTQPSLAIAVDGDTLPETTMTETIALATDVHNVHASTKFCNRFGGSTVTVVNTGSTAIELAANPALEAETETTYDTCERLACLYTVRDHLKAKQHDESKSSEFLTAAVGIPTPELMAVIDQHMEAIKVVYPSEYNAIVAKIRSLHEAT